MADPRREREAEEEWGRVTPETVQQRAARRASNHVVRVAAMAEGLVLIGAVAVVLLIVGLAIGGPGWTVAGIALLVVLIGGLVALRIAHRDADGRPVPLSRRRR